VNTLISSTNFKVKHRALRQPSRAVAADNLRAPPISN